MSRVEAPCPACGAPVVFKVGSSIVTVCEYCNSVVARGDRQLEDLGKVAEIVDTGSPLDVGLKGVYRGVAFELTGRAQLGHAMGGVWDEWYAAFADGRWGWLAEAQGRFYLTFHITLPEPSQIPPFELLALGQPVTAIPVKTPLVVAEKGTATAQGARGEIPYKLVPGETYQYADLSGPGGAFATLDYSEMPPLVFIGREVTLKDLGISASAPAPEREARRVGAIQISCPRCGGPLDLRAPETERVACPNCGSLLDAAQGKLRFLEALKPPPVKPIIPLGATGDLAGTRYTVIGFMVRSVEFEGVRYFWEEYLLYEPRAGFRWLVRSDDQWSFVEPVPPGEVMADERAAQFRGQRFKIFQHATARVEHVLGEFYWKVTVGEQVRASDYVRPPLMLSREVSTGAAVNNRHATPEETGEINWSLGTYMRPREVEKAFNISGLPRPSNVAPNQPFLYKRIYLYWAIFFALTCGYGLLSVIVSAIRSRTIFQQTYQFQPLAGPDATQIVFSATPLTIDPRQNLTVYAAANIDNTWVGIEGDLINEETGLVQQFSLPIEYYYGVEDGESWSEGSRSTSASISALPAGKYTLRLEAQWEKWQQPVTVNVRIEEGTPRLGYLLLALVGVSLIPAIVLYKHIKFESRRWADSDYSMFG
jgi:ssDNA-binding Zn-finger/Zn-ribbon topoisomerase 1